MNWMGKLACLAVCAVAGAAAAAPRLPNGLVKPTDDELRAMMENISVLPSYDQNMGGATLTILGDPEIYCPGGVFVRGQPQRNPQIGTWSVQDGQLCNETQARGKQCVFAFSHPQAGIVFSARRDGKQAVRPLNHKAFADDCPVATPAS